MRPVYCSMKTRHPVFRLFIILNLCIWVMPVFGQQDIKDLEWQEGRPLTWSDFPYIRLKSGKKELALTSVKHKVTGRMVEGAPDFEVKVYFIVKDSWTTDTTSVNLLAHEQLHFDIGELYRRKIAKKVKRLRDTGERQKAIYRYAIKKLLSDFRIFSREYDKATRHGTLLPEQKKWEIRIKEELNRLQ